MDDARSQFTFYISFYDALRRIRKAADRAAAYDMLVEYALFGTEPDVDKLPDSVAIAYHLIKPTLDKSREKAKSGKRGGENKKTESKTEANRKQTASKTEANGKRGQNASEKEGEKEIEIEKEIEKESLNPLTPLRGSEALKQAVSEWLHYKRERKEVYQPTGQKALMTEIENNVKVYGETAVIGLIRQCMANGWKGIIFDRLKTAPAGKGAAAPPGDLEMEAMRRMLQGGADSG